MPRHPPGGRHLSPARPQLSLGPARPDDCRCRGADRADRARRAARGPPAGQGDPADPRPVRGRRAPRCGRGAGKPRVHHVHVRIHGRAQGGDGHARGDLQHVGVDAGRLSSARRRSGRAQDVDQLYGLDLGDPVAADGRGAARCDRGRQGAVPQAPAPAAAQAPRRGDPVRAGADAAVPRRARSQRRSGSPAGSALCVQRRRSTSAASGARLVPPFSAHTDRQCVRDDRIGDLRHQLRRRTERRRTGRARRLPDRE